MPYHFHLEFACIASLIFYTIAATIANYNINAADPKYIFSFSSKLVYTFKGLILQPVLLNFFLYMPQQHSTSINSAQPQSLVITKAGKQKLSKNQEAFNKLTQKIEKLQKDIAKKQLQFDLALKIYGNELYPAQLKMLAQLYKLIIALWHIYQSNKLAKPDQRHLKNVVQFYLKEYFLQTDIEPDEILQNIFSQLEGISYDKMMQLEKEKEWAEMQELLKTMEVDAEGLDIDDEAAVAAKLAEARQKMAAIQAEQEEEHKQRQQQKNKTAKQLEHEKLQKTIAEMKQKNISTIYKQLAKLFHPDLEQDAEKKVEKEILMKELTAAYEAKNLHALLTLELRWINKESDHLETLTDEKLAIYLQILKEQATNLEWEKKDIIQQPQYAVLVNQFGYAVQKYPVEMVQQQLKTAQTIARDFEDNITNFTSAHALRHVKEMLKQWKLQEQELDEQEEIMRMLFR